MDNLHNEHERVGSTGAGSIYSSVPQEAFLISGFFLVR